MLGFSLHISILHVLSTPKLLLIELALYYLASMDEKIYFLEVKYGLHLAYLGAGGG